jgi:hypothetical protein
MSAKTIEVEGRVAYLTLIASGDDSDWSIGRHITSSDSIEFFEFDA